MDMHSTIGFLVIEDILPQPLPSLDVDYLVTMIAFCGPIMWLRPAVMQLAGPVPLKTVLCDQL